MRRPRNGISPRLARTAATALAVLGVLAVPAAAGATTVLNFSPNAGIPCAAQSDGVRFCEGSTTPPAPSVPPTGVPSSATAPVAIDGTILDVNVTLPAAPPSGPDGGYPLVIIGHGYGGQKQPLDGREAPWLPTAHELARRGYAVLNATDRGFNGSCGTPASRLANPQGCAQGWNHLMDGRYEVRDAQNLAGALADEGFVDPQRIGAIGESYGGGESLMLATLRNRELDPSSGRLVPWVSPDRHLPMQIAAATPTIPWSDLVSSLTPNGRALDYIQNDPNANFTPPGIEKLSFVSGLFAAGQIDTGSGQPIGYYAPPGVDPTADLTTWYTRINAGEPYDGDPVIGAALSQLSNFRSALHLLDGSAQGSPDTVPPAPMLLSNGFTDDLFPVDETVRYANLERSLFPTDPLELTYMDYGHQRGANKPADVRFLLGQVNAWLDHYVMGTGGDPGQPVTALTQTCPNTAPSGGPFTADSWPALHPGLLTYVESTPQSFTSAGGDPTVSKTFDPIVAGQDPCATAPAADEPDTLNVRLPAATGAGYTMLGAPLIVAQIAISGQYPEIAGRLLDVAPDGTETLVSRGLYRPTGDGLVYFELHPGAWHFAAGHVPKLELLGRDVPYARPSNGAFQITVPALAVLLPTHETSGNGIVPLQALPAPAGSTAAPGVRLYTPASVLAVSGRTSGRCPSARNATVRVPRRRGARILRVTERIGSGRAHRVRVRSGRRVLVALAGRPPGVVRVVIRITYRRGAHRSTLTLRRTYRLCTTSRR